MPHRDDAYTRECFVIEVDASISHRGSDQSLTKLVRIHGAPKVLRSDHGPEFISRMVQTRLCEEGIQTAIIAPGKPWQHGRNESDSLESRGPPRRLTLSLIFSREINSRMA